MRDWLQISAVIAVVSVTLGIAVAYANEKAGFLGGLGVGLVLALPCAWVIARVAAKRPPAGPAR